MSKVRCVVALLILTPWMTGCEGGDDDGQPAFHECGRSFNDDWLNRELLVLHHEPRLCPVKAESNDLVFTGGDVYDRGRREAERSILRVFNSNGAPVADNFEDFKEEPGFFSDNDWWAQISLSYEAWTGASNFDRGDYSIRLLSGFTGQPEALFEVTYDQGCNDCF